jgi:hypothetical protein
MLLADILGLEQFNRALISIQSSKNDLPNAEIAQESQFKVALSYFQGDFPWSLHSLKSCAALPVN